MSLDMMPKSVVTVVDVLECGACIEGVFRWVDKTKRISGPPVDDEDSAGWLAKAANLNGYGNGYGYGNGNGYGNGYGNGNGYGYGYGYGNGNGYGNGGLDW